MSRIMAKYLVRCSCIALLLGLTIAAGAKVRWRTVAPQRFDRKVTLRISEKNRTYYLLRKDCEIEVRLTGPTKLRVISRAEIPSSKKQSRYTYLVRRDDGKPVEFSRRGKVSAEARPARNGSTKLSAGEKHVLNVPAGSHSYTFRLPEKSSDRLFLRFHQLEGDLGAPTQVVAMTPQLWTKSVDLVVREETTTYYRLGEENEIALRLIGPAKLKVLARLEFHPDMQGQQDFRLQVLEDGLIKATYPLSTTESDVCQYLETSTLVPAKAEIFYLDIPQGEHDYRFVLLDGNHTVLLKFLLPKKDLGGEQ
ncbi:MAG: hypothetical protein V1784_08375 [bacterium]